MSERTALEVDLSKKFSDDIRSVIDRTYAVTKAGGMSTYDAVIMMSAVLMDQAIDTICVCSRNEKLMVTVFGDRVKAMVKWHNEH